MTSFHERAKQLMSQESPQAKDSELLAHAEQAGYTVPAALLDWVQFDGGGLLEKYSNDDFCNLATPSLVQAEDGRLGLQIQRENQGNFDKILLLDGSDDPPVMFAWLCREPWRPYAERFSDFVLAQLFDWQHALEFDEEYGDKMMRHVGYIQLRGVDPLTWLRHEFSESVTSSAHVEDEEFREYRFHRDWGERITLTVSPSGTSLSLTGPDDTVVSLEERLLQQFRGSVVPTPFNSSRGVARVLARYLDTKRLVHLRSLFAEEPSEKAVEALQECHRESPLLQRVNRVDFPRGENNFHIGGQDWGVRLHFSSVKAHWWQLQSLTVDVP